MSNQPYERHRQTIGRYEVFIRGDQADVIIVDQALTTVRNMTAQEALGLMSWLHNHHEELYQAAQAEEQPPVQDLEALYGPLFAHSDHKPGEHITYTAYDGQIRSGEILWVQGPGQTPRGYQLRAQYVVAIDEQYQAGTMGIDFVPLGEVQSGEKPV